MKKDYSYGIIPFCKKGGRYYIFIIKHLGGHWSFPKGHPDSGEEPIQTAIRELFEETGLKINENTLLTNPILEENYTFRHQDHFIQKKVQYFIGEVELPDDVTLDYGEILEGKWVEVNEAPMHVTYEEAKKICRETAQILQGGKQ